MLGAASSSQMTISSVKTTYSGEIKIVTPTLKDMDSGMDSDVREICRGV